MLLKDIVRASLVEVVAQRYGISDIEMSLPKDPSRVDYATPVALKLAKQVGRPPLEVAQEIAQDLHAHDTRLQVEVAPPGFLNITVRDQLLLEHLRGGFHKHPLQKGENGLVMIEYASLNMGKPATIGHLLNMIHGEAMKRILKWYGYQVHAVDHIGDWGTQFAKMLVALHRWGDRQEVEAHPIETLVHLYVRFHDEAEANPALEDEAREVFARLEKGDPDLKKEWQWIVTLNMEENMKLYEELGVSFDSQVGESFYVSMVPEVIQLMLDRGIAERNEDGSVAVVFEKHGIDLPSCLLAKRDGSSLYHARDLATAKYRQETFHPSRIIHVVGEEQSLYFRQLIAMLTLLGWTQETVWTHMSYGHFSLKEGKISTRKGRVIYAKELIQEGKARAKQLLKERGMNIDAIEDGQELVDILALGAVFYANLSQNRLTGQVFDWDKALAFEGNSAPYIQYVGARTRSLLKKAQDLGVQPRGDLPLHQELSLHERALLVKLLQFPEAVESCIPDLRSNLLTLYLYELSTTFNRFYTECSILQEQNEALRSLRLYLVSETRFVIAQGLELLNIGAPEYM